MRRAWASVSCRRMRNSSSCPGMADGQTRWSSTGAAEAMRSWSSQDRGRVRSGADGWFEVIAGKAIPADGRPACFGYVQTYDTKPRRRLFEVLRSQGMQANQQVTFLTDGGEDIRDIPCYLNVQAEHLLDWFH